MDALLERLSSGQIVAVISLITGGIVALAMLVSLTKYQFHSLAEDTTLRHEKHQPHLTLPDKLIDLTLERGAEDNVTVIVVRYRPNSTAVVSESSMLASSSGSQ